MRWNVRACRPLPVLGDDLVRGAIITSRKADSSIPYSSAVCERRRSSAARTPAAMKARASSSGPRRRSRRRRRRRTSRRGGRQRSPGRRAPGRAARRPRCALGAAGQRRAENDPHVLALRAASLGPVLFRPFAARRAGLACRSRRMSERLGRLVVRFPPGGQGVQTTIAGRTAQAELETHVVGPGAARPATRRARSCPGGCRRGRGCCARRDRRPRARPLDALAPGFRDSTEGGALRELPVPSASSTNASSSRQPSTGTSSSVTLARTEVAASPRR